MLGRVPIESDRVSRKWCFMALRMHCQIPACCHELPIWSTAHGAAEGYTGGIYS